MEDTRNSAGVETGTIGILVFNTGPYRLGINLGKVREIIRQPVIKPVPYSHPIVEGVFELRSRLIPALNLRAWLELDSRYLEPPRVVITEFLGLQIGFLVDRVDRIIRVEWTDIEPPAGIKRFSPLILGTVRTEQNGGLINLIDYEHIVLSINPEVILAETRGRRDSKSLVKKRADQSIWIVEDSKTIRDFLKELLKENGYTNIIFFENGKHALDTLTVIKKKLRHAWETVGTGEDTDRVALIITDIEMPVMDGYAFIKAVKSDNRLRTIPIILFSSLIASENKLKGEIAAADAQLAKSDSANLIGLMDRFIFK
jgi:two-component system chemotaxis response regulator CheV